MKKNGQKGGRPPRRESQPGSLRCLRSEGRNLKQGGTLISEEKKTWNERAKRMIGKKKGISYGYRRNLANADRISAEKKNTAKTWVRSLPPRGKKSLRSPFDSLSGASPETVRKRGVRRGFQKEIRELMGKRNLLRTFFSSAGMKRVREKRGVRRKKVNLSHSEKEKRTWCGHRRPRGCPFRYLIQGREL